MPDIKDIHDIRVPVRVGMDPMLIRILVLVLILLLVAGLGYWLYRYLKKRRRKGDKPMLMLPMPRPPAEIAMMELDALRDLMGVDARRYYFRLTGILKAYLGRKYRFNAPEMTTQELCSHLKLLPLDRSMASTLKGFLAATDTVKYAGMSPGTQTMNDDDGFVRSFILTDSQAETRKPDRS
ncbi:MAG: hypothetical protein V1793_12275 [Pseudomonadota bacterium]